MLQKLLNEIQAGGVLEAGVLAARLGVSPQMVAVMLEHLQRLGRLQNLESCGVQNCGGCSQGAACAPQSASGQRVWRLQESP